MCSATKLLYPDTTGVTYTWDKAGRLESLADWANRTTSYQYFPDGALKAATNINGTTTQYARDNARRLTEVRHQQGATTIGRHSYTLDAAGNRAALDELARAVPRGWAGGLVQSEGHPPGRRHA